MQPSGGDYAEVGLSALTVLFRIWFVHLVDLALAVPHVPTVVRFFFFYTFAQALGLLWGFVVIILQALSRQLVSWLVSDAEVPDARGAVALVARCYAVLAMLRMIGLAAGGLWTLAWEASSDFPTVQRLLLRPKRREGGAPSAYAVLAIPIAIITLAFAASGAAPAFCAETGACGSGWLAEQLLTADGRGNRMLRFSLVILILQWAQIFESLSPLGVLGLCKAAPPARKAALLLLLPVSLARLSQFAWRPTDHVVFGSAALLGLSRHACDNLLAVLWGIWLFMAVKWAAVKWAPTMSDTGADVGTSSTDAEAVQRGRSAPALAEGCAGGAVCRLDVDADAAALEAEVWAQVSIRFQYTFVLAALLYWGRAFLSPHIGWTFAQNDLMALCTLYPAMCIAVWSATYVSVSLWRAQPRWAALASALAAVAAITAWPTGRMVLAALHLMRQVQKALGARFVRYSVNLRSATKSREVERRLASRVVHCMAFILVAWFTILSGLALLASAQQHLGFYPSRMELEVDGPPGSATVRIGHRAIVGSHLTLSQDPTAPAPLGTYGVCNQTWGGLGILDYALLSLAAYWDVDDPQLTEVLAHLFPVSKSLHAVVVNGSRTAPRGGHGGMPWVEVMLPKQGAHVVAVRGTDPTKMADVVEDLHMWTEPVVLGILSLVFPAIHAWPGPLVDNWVATTHGLLGILGLQAGPWMYEPLAAHLRAGRTSADGSGGSLPRLTGHSLGGSIAQVAAALEGTSVVAISPPGLLQTFMKHWRPRAPTERADHVKAAHRRSVSVVVEGDWISRFDSHAGFVQTIACERDDLSVFGGCHLLENTICHLLIACGDMHGRWQRCAHSFEPHVEMASIASALPGQVAAIIRGWSENWSARSALVALCAATAVQLLVLERVVGGSTRRKG